MPGVLYRREREILEYLAQFQRQYGYSPTLMEMAHATGHSSKSTIHAIIKALVDKGYVQKVEGNNRVLKIVDQNVAYIKMGAQPAIDLPLMGYIAAGKPLEPYSDPNATFQVPGNLITGKKTAFVLQVKGSSLIEDGILDGDYVVIEKVQEASNGDIVVAIVDDSLATLKKYYIEDGKVALKPANANMEPIYPSKLLIQGKAVSIIRKL